MSYNNSSITYDALGNPTTYLDNTLTWEKGRQLKSYGSIASFEYNGRGIRTKKTTNNLVTEYFLDGTKILAQNDKLMSESVLTENLMEFLYGIDGVIGFKLNNNSYYYKKNLQGDIIGIYNSDLQLIAKYAYDAWGNHKISYLEGSNFVDFNNESSYTNISNNNLYIALKNPFRYRSYYYDQETSLYYLNSRYYDPRTGRFINVDDLSVLDITNIALNGINLYAYCLNNPVNDIDSEGNLSWWQWLLFGIGAVLVIASAVVLTIASGGTALGVFGTIAVGTAKGVLIGAGVGTALGAIGGGIYSAVTGADFWSSVASGAAMGFGIGAIIGGLIGGSVAGIQVANAAKMWSKGTFKSGFQSMKYHFKTHVINQGYSKNYSIIQYTNEALNFSNKYSHLFKFDYSNKYNMIRWIYGNSDALGYFDKLGKIITYILKR